jgi:hypothetical protein
MGRYASGSIVSEGRSKEEIEKLLVRFGADQFMSGWDKEHSRVMIGFRFDGRAYRIQIAMLDRDDETITHTPTGYERAKGTADKEFSKETRRRWRVLAAYIKALVVGVEENVLRWEEALLPYAILETGQTVAEVMLPRMDAAMESGQLSVKLLPAMGETT